MSLIAQVWRKYRDMTGKGHLCLHPGMELWAEMVRLWRYTNTIAHIYTQDRSGAWKELFITLCFEGICQILKLQDLLWSHFHTYSSRHICLF